MRLYHLASCRIVSRNQLTGGCAHNAVLRFWYCGTCDYRRRSAHIPPKPGSSERDDCQ